MAESEFKASPRSISSAVYTTNAEGELVQLELMPGHPHYQLVRRGQRVLAASCYANQKAELEERFAKDGTDVFVASLSVIQSKLGEIRSYCVMTKGVPTLLPEADAVAIVFPEAQAKSFMVPWAKALAVAPGLWERAAEEEPPRYRTLSFPDEATEQALRQHALD